MLKQYINKTIILFILTFPVHLQAGQLGISPLKVQLTSEVQVQALTLRNLTDDPIVVAIKPYHWQQQDNIDRYKLANDLIISPPIVKIRGKSSQIIRVGLREPLHAPSEIGTEEPYRIYVQEVLDQTTAAKSQLAVALRLGIPVFVQRGNPVAADVTWRLTRTATGAKVTASNKGGQHLIVHNLSLNNRDSTTPVYSEKVFQYLLPGTTYQWEIKATDTKLVNLDNLVLAAKTTPKVAATKPSLV